jgi:hypothetical protein
MAVKTTRKKSASAAKVTVSRTTSKDLKVKPGKAAVLKGGVPRM